MDEADANADDKLSRSEFNSLGRNWFSRLDSDKEGRVTHKQFIDRFGEATMGRMLPPRGPDGPNDLPPPEGGPQPAMPGRFVSPELFKKVDSNADGFLTIGDLQEVFDRWFKQWDGAHDGFLDEEELRAGLARELGGINPPFQGGPNRQNGRGGFGGGPGRGRGGVQVQGVKLDPLFGANDPKKPLISKLLAVPKLRTRYLAIVRELTETWLDWKRLGPIAEKYQQLIAQKVEEDTRKLDSTEDFRKGLIDDIPGRGMGPQGRGTIGLKSFVEQRAAFLNDYLKGAKERP